MSILLVAYGNENIMSSITSHVSTTNGVLSYHVCVTCWKTNVTHMIVTLVV